MEWLDNLIAAIMAFFAQIVAVFSGLFGGSEAAAEDATKELSKEKDASVKEAESKSE